METADISRLASLLNECSLMLEKRRPQITEAVLEYKSYKTDARLSPMTIPSSKPLSPTSTVSLPTMPKLTKKESFTDPSIQKLLPMLMAMDSSDAEANKTVGRSGRGENVTGNKFLDDERDEFNQVDDQERMHLHLTCRISGDLLNLTVSWQPQFERLKLEAHCIQLYGREQYSLLISQEDVEALFEGRPQLQSTTLDNPMICKEIVGCARIEQFPQDIAVRIVKNRAPERKHLLSYVPIVESRLKWLFFSSSPPFFSKSKKKKKLMLFVFLCFVVEILKTQRNC